jgi:hypothetical protein
MQEKVPTTTPLSTKNAYIPNDPKHAWKKIAPTSGETTKVVDKKIFNWCINHKAWGQQTYKKCRDLATNKNST